MLSFPMPFPRVPCAIWEPIEGDPDAYGNTETIFMDEPTWQGMASYAPGGKTPETENDVTDGRPHGDEVTVTAYLPKTYQGNPRGGYFVLYPEDDAALYGRRWQVIGDPISYMRDATPGDFSWVIKGVESLG